MKCKFCGSEINGTPKVCDVCGHEIVYSDTKRQPTQESETVRKESVKPSSQKKPVKKRKPKKIFGINAWFLAVCAGLLAVIILILTLIIVSLVGGEEIETSNIHTFFSKTTGVTNIVESGTVYGDSVEGTVVKKQISSDGKTMGVLTEFGELHVISGGETALISTGVKNFVISSDGSKIAYVIRQVEESSTDETTTEKEKANKQKKTQDEEETTEYVPAGAEEFIGADLSLFMYNCADGNSTHIENAVSQTSISLSPTGRAVCYAKSEDDGESFVGYVCRDGVFSTVGRNSLPVAVSDDGSFLYYVKYEIYEDSQALKLFVKNGEKEEKLGEYTDGNGLLMYLNSSFSEAVFSVTGKNGNFFLWTAEKEKQKISSGFSPVYPHGKTETSNGKAVIVPDESFANFVFSDNEKAARFIDKNYYCNAISSKSDSYKVNADMSKLYYVDANEYLYAVNLKNTEGTNIASHVIIFDISVDGEMLYYVNSDKELHCFTGSHDKPLAENVYTGKNGLSVTEGGYLYYLKDYNYESGTLCYIKGDGSEHVVEDAENVHDIIADKGDCIYYRSDYGTITGTYELYYGKMNKYEMIFRNMG